MSKKIWNKLESQLAQHARKHRLKLIECNGLIEANFDEAKVMICESAHYVQGITKDGLMTDDAMFTEDKTLTMTVQKRAPFSKICLCKECDENSGLEILEVSKTDYQP